jgi:hypothetical protein
MIARKKMAIVIDTILFVPQHIDNSDTSYGLATVFCNNYFQLMQPYLNEQGLSQKIYKRENYRILFSFFLKRLSKIEKRQLSTEPGGKTTLQILAHHYLLKSYFSIFMLKLFFLRVKKRISRI